jgi:hypothetical protein
MCNKVTNEYGSLCKERDTWTRERVLIFIPWIYNRLLIVFHICTRNRQINLYFPHSQILPFIFDTGSYKDSFNHRIREVER